MKKYMLFFGLIAAYCLVLAGCAGESGASTGNPYSTTNGGRETAAVEDLQTDKPEETPPMSDGGGKTEIDEKKALSIALENAGVPTEDAYEIQVQRDREGEISIFQVEFETKYGSYHFEIAVSDGKIVGADYEVDEEWLDTLGGSPVTEEQAKQIVQDKVPGSQADDVKVWEESGDGRGRFEGELYCDGMKYEFEIDPRTGIIFDWNADLRN